MHKILFGVLKYNRSSRIIILNYFVIYTICIVLSFNLFYVPLFNNLCVSLHRDGIIKGCFV